VEERSVTREEYDAFCAGLRGAHHVVQWGDASVWKVGGKVFAIGGWSESPEFAVTFKCSQTSFAVLKDLPGMRPAPYLASRGLTWLQRTDDRSLSDAALEDYLRQSHALVVAGLPRKEGAA
jgi:predicted DNA-binding protein (MmcQ/YjbR family)